MGEFVGKSFMEEINLRWNLKKWFKWLWFFLYNKNFVVIKYVVWGKKNNRSVRFILRDDGGKMNMSKKYGLG